MRKVETLGSVGEVNDNALNGRRIRLTSRQQEVLDYTALGLSSKEIAEKMAISPRVVQNHHFAISHAFSTYNVLGAIIKGVETGHTDLNEATEGLDKNDILKLSKREKEVLDAMTRNGGENNSNEEIALLLSLNEKTVKKHCGSISRKLGLNKTRAALLYIAFRRENTLPDL